MIYQCPQCHASHEIDGDVMPRFCPDCGASLAQGSPDVQPEPQKQASVSPETPQSVSAAPQSASDDLQEYPLEKAFFFGIITLGILPALKWSKTATAILNTFDDKDIRCAKSARVFCEWWGYIYIIGLVITIMAMLEGFSFADRVSSKIEMFCYLYLGSCLTFLPWQKAIRNDLLLKFLVSIGMFSILDVIMLKIDIESLTLWLVILVAYGIGFLLFQMGVNRAARAARERLSSEK